MTQFLPANLLALFAPRDPLPYMPPPVPKHAKEDDCTLIGVGQYCGLFEDPDDTPEATRCPTKLERKETKRMQKEQDNKDKIERESEAWDPNTDENATGDAFKTVFVSRINYDTRDDKLRREFEEFGYIRSIHMVRDNKTGKPRGYAFIEYETEKGMRAAYKYGDGRKIDGRRVVVDIERGRTVKNWKPRRLGGGLGGSRIGAPDQNVTHSGRVDLRGYQDKLARAARQRDRELALAMGKEDPHKDRERSKSRDRSERGETAERRRDDEDRGAPAERRMPRATDEKKTDEKREKSSDDKGTDKPDRRRDADRRGRDDDRGDRPPRRDRDEERPDRSERRRDRGDRDDRKRERRDDDRDRDRKRDRRDDRDRDSRRGGDRDRERRDDRDERRDRGDDSGEKKSEEKVRDANGEEVKVKTEMVEENEVAAT